MTWPSSWTLWPGHNTTAQASAIGDTKFVQQQIASNLPAYCITSILISRLVNIPIQLYPQHFPIDLLWEILIVNDDIVTLIFTSKQLKVPSAQARGYAEPCLVWVGSNRFRWELEDITQSLPQVLNRHGCHWTSWIWDSLKMGHLTLKLTTLIRNMMIYWWNLRYCWYSLFFEGKHMKNKSNRKRITWVSTS